MANIRDVARLAGVSITTVSRVMNYDLSYRTTEETRQKVWKAAGELNYMLPERPHIKPTNSSSGSMPRIGCVVNCTPDHYLDPFYVAAEQGMQAYLTEQGYSLYRSFGDMNASFEELRKDVLSASLDALICFNQYDASFMRELRDTVPVLVQVADTYRQNGCDLISYNHEEAVKLALDHLVERGHTKIAYIGSLLIPRSPIFEEDPRVRSFRSNMLRLNLPIRPEWMLDCHWTRTICREKTLELLNGPERPTAILTGSDHMAAIVLNTLYEQRVRVPDEMAVASICDLEFARYTTPPLTSVYVPSMEMGRFAAETLLKRLAGDQSPKKITLFPVSLSVRQTT